MNDIIGKKFGRLTVIKKDKTKTYNFLCVCVCDNNKISSVRIYALLNGHTNSCGCLTREIRGNLSKKHGETKHILYKYWSSMRRRCNNKNTLDYPFYGGRGIIHDPRWNDFLEFKKDMYFKYLYAKKQLRMKRPSIERIDVREYLPFPEIRKNLVVRIPFHQRILQEKISLELEMVYIKLETQKLEFRS